MARDGSQAGAPLHFELYTEEDKNNYMRWKWISKKKEAHNVLRGIDAALLQRSGLHDALWLDWFRPEEGDDNRQSSMVDDQGVPVNVNVIRNVFSLENGKTALRSARHYEDLSDRVLERSKTAKTCPRAQTAIHRAALRMLRTETALAVMHLDNPTIRLMQSRARVKPRPDRTAV
ncbi:hypothetical protein R1sor_022860 [Riccia sorocarpa]|uniref:Uncharacterized protein n=1 Tax=Riccia sorocarpa TaxID=122646 RepID=A0ABD3GN88_9MARC